MSPHAPEAFLLLTLPNVHLTSGAFSQRDVLALECLTVPDAPVARDVFLVLRLGNFEAAVDPERHISLSVARNGERMYTFHRTSTDAAEILLRVPPAGEKHTYASADIESFDGILEQYANFRHGAHAEPTPDGAAYKIQDAQEDLRGRLVLVDQDNGEIIGAVGGERAHVHAEAEVTRPGHEHDPVYIEVPADGELDEHELFIRAIPPGEHNFITRSASMISTSISGAANLLTSGMTTASNMYIARAVPHPSASPAKDGSPPVLPPRPVQWMTSTEGKKRMQTVNNYTGKAVVVSGKTVKAVEGIVKRMVGGASTVYDRNVAKGKAPAGLSGGSASPRPYAPTGQYAPTGYPIPQYGMRSSPHGSPQPPPYAPTKLAIPDPQYPSSKSVHHSPIDRASPPFPARRGQSAPPSPYAPPSPGPSDKLNTKERIILSANLIAGTLGKSAKQVMDVGSDRLSAMVGHKYGAEAGHSTRMMTGAVRNVGLVYVDVAGLGRRALLKTAGKEFVKARIKGRKYNLRTDANGEVVQAAPATPLASPGLK